MSSVSYLFDISRGLRRIQLTHVDYVGRPGTLASAAAAHVEWSELMKRVRQGRQGHWVVGQYVPGQVQEARSPYLVRTFALRL